jgi:hypothetical protein
MVRLAGFLAISLFLLPALAVARSSGPARSTVTFIVIHTIGGPSCQDSSVVYPPIKGDAKEWMDYFIKDEVLGIHYVIDRDGQTLAGIPENQIANHAKGSNATSIGIELVNDGDGSDPFPLEQISALVKLLCRLRSSYSISVDDIKGHSEVDNRMCRCGSSSFKKKVDPGTAFPWQKVREAVFACSLAKPKAGNSDANPRPSSSIGSLSRSKPGVWLQALESTRLRTSCPHSPTSPGP